LSGYLFGYPLPAFPPPLGAKHFTRREVGLRPE
jgi:hypothetical protein